MANRLLLSVLFVPLFWGFMGTYGQNNTTAAPNVTTVSEVNATNPTNVTTTPATSVTGNSTTNPANMTTVPANNGSTMGAGNNVTNPANMTTVPANNGSTMGAGNSVTNPANMTTTPANNGSTMGAGNNMTTTTTAPPVAPNSTVETLETNITRTGCGSTQLCAAEPLECNPSSEGSCFFLAAKQRNGQNFDFELSGESDGYIAATLSTDSTLGNNDTTYVCARSSQGVKFFGARLNNGKLTKQEVNANSVKGKTRGKQIQCTFLATLPALINRASTVSLSVSTGAYNETSEDLGDPSAVIRSTGVNLADPNATVTNEITPNATTAAPTASTTPTLIPVAALATPVSRENCGTSKLCAAEPKTCDPSTGNQCFFISAQQQSGQIFGFELSGETDGYIGCGLSTSNNVNGSHRAYICANNNGNVTFLTATLNNSQLSFEQLNASNVKGAVSSRKVQCTFVAELPDTLTRAAQYSLSVFNGTYNARTGEFGTPDFKIFTSRVNLTDPNANTTNLIGGAYPVIYQQPLIPALLVTVVMMTFTAL